MASEPVAGLIQPIQSAGAEDQINAAPGTLRYAVQAGYTWSNGSGVPQNLTQGLLWFQEADRLQGMSGDRSYSDGIAEMLRIYGWTDIRLLLEKGQIYGGGNNFVEATFFLGRAADLGSIQGMAALGWVYEQRRNPTMQGYWCRKAYRLSRDTGFRDFEIDAINYFCAPPTFADLVLPAEIAMNRESTARGLAASAAVRRDVEAINAFARAFAASMQSSPRERASADAEASMDFQIDRNIRRDCLASGSTMC